MKKWILGIAGVVLAATLAGCGSSTVANMKGAKITKDDYYQEMKSTTSGQSTLRSMIVLKALEQQYGKKVSDKKVTAQYNKVKSQYGSSFSSALQQSGLTTKTFKEQIKTSLLSSVALKDLKKPTQKQIDAQWKKYQPKITVQHILVAKKDKADELIADLKKDNSEANFKKLAKANSTDTATASDAGKLSPFDNTDTSLDATFKAAAFKLTKAGDFTQTPVKTSYGYHIIRAIKVPAKGKKADHTAELKKQLYTKWESDTTVMTGVIKKVLKKANVSIKDSDLKNVLSVYLNPSSASSTGSSTAN
ncbi:peptidylprolyl isomerase [Lacticaseibacillus porcinae]|uniref:peptidylprolyl isomerase n=1 Tax=Lacticaseibacillus porcinae TaxID=1123687 RepID=UPI000F77FFCB|nr:peptidylprolyl isomerase [Lacticaseibacillus porcinae]